MSPGLSIDAELAHVKKIFIFSVVKLLVHVIATTVPPSLASAQQTSKAADSFYVFSARRNFFWKSSIPVFKPRLCASYSRNFTHTGLTCSNLCVKRLLTSLNLFALSLSFAIFCKSFAAS